MKTTAVCFPFDLFGSPGAGAGAELLADELREMLADNRRERVPTRALAYQDQVGWVALYSRSLAIWAEV